jgi:hypothetical protein
MTDGVADDLEPAQLPDFFDALYQDLSTRNRRRGRRWLQSELNDWATPCTATTSHWWPYLGRQNEHNNSRSTEEEQDGARPTRSVL